MLFQIISLLEFSQLRVGALLARVCSSAQIQTNRLRFLDLQDCSASACCLQNVDLAVYLTFCINEDA